MAFILITVNQCCIADRPSFGELLATVGQVQCTGPKVECRDGHRVHRQCKAGEKQNDKVF